MNQRTSLADTLGDIRRDSLQLDDIDRQGRSIHRESRHGRFWTWDGREHPW